MTYTALLTSLSILLGFLIARAVDTIPRILRGPTAFVSLLPMIVTPLVGAPILFWMVDARGPIGAAVQWVAGDPGLSLEASTVPACRPSRRIPSRAPRSTAAPPSRRSAG